MTGMLSSLASRLKTTGNFGNGLYGGVVVATRRHELQVVDNEHAQAVLGFESSCHGAHLEHVETGSVVDEHGHIAQLGDGVGDFEEIVVLALVRKFTGAQAPERCARRGRD